MLRQTLLIFVTNLSQNEPHFNFDEALNYLRETQFHKRLRDEITMIPIPKLKIKKNISKTGISIWNKDWVISQQSHILEWAIDRVNNSPKITLKCI